VLRRYVLPWVALLALAGCAGEAERESTTRPAVEVTLQAHDQSGAPADREQIRRAAEILRERLAGLDASGSVAEAPDAGRIVVRVDGPPSERRESVLSILTHAAELELFDLEGNLVTPSIDADGAFPVATASLYDLLVGRQSPAREDDVVDWYLFDPASKLVAGPAPTKRLLLPNGPLLDGWRILGTPPGTAVLECGIGEIVCPGVPMLNPQQDSYYLIRVDPPDVPELDGGDLEPEGTRQDVDPSTGEPVVTMQFTAEGAKAFGELTRDVAKRGRRLARAVGDPTIMHHFALVLDSEIKSWPTIDWRGYPNGIGGELGAQIAGIRSVDEARGLAAVLRAGALPVQLTVVSRVTVD